MKSFISQANSFSRPRKLPIRHPITKAAMLTRNQQSLHCQPLCPQSFSSLSIYYLPLKPVPTLSLFTTLTLPIHSVYNNIAINTARAKVHSCFLGRNSPHSAITQCTIPPTLWLKNTKLTPPERQPINNSHRHNPNQTNLIPIYTTPLYKLLRNSTTIHILAIITTYTFTILKIRKLQTIDPAIVGSKPRLFLLQFLAEPELNLLLTSILNPKLNPKNWQTLLPQKF